ncbi:DM13 domain-containing protein [Streptomyces sp. NPDC101776]|uniref:DM13 domain-containing protein n=1 Tax=Streptomyces sp. NPDC101776 TaxID=3366146 RepID=UPI003803D3E3
MFAGLNGKKVTGSAQVSGSDVTLSGFTSDEGPDLHVYLTNGTDEAAVSAGKQLGAVKFDKASQMFALSGVDAAGYTTVVIHCDKAKAVFGAAKLS